MCAPLVGRFGLMAKAWAQLPLPAGCPEGLRAHRSEPEPGLPEKSRREQRAWDTCVRTLPPRPSVKGVGVEGAGKLTERGKDADIERIEKRDERRAIQER